MIIFQDDFVKFLNEKMAAANFIHPTENCVEECLDNKPESRSLIVKVIFEEIIVPKEHEIVKFTSTCSIVKKEGVL